MEITFTLDQKSLEAFKLVIREEVLAALKEHGTFPPLKKKPSAKAEKADKLEEQAQAAVAEYKELPKLEVTDDDLPENMQPKAVDELSEVLRDALAKGSEELHPVEGHIYTNQSGYNQSGYTQMPGSQLPVPEKDRPIEAPDKLEFGPRVRALALSPGVLKEWITRNTGLVDPWQMGYFRFKLMLGMFEQAKSGGNEAIAKFIAGV